MNDSLVLDIGGEIGALVVHTGPGMDATEIELSPIEDDQARFHNMVHPRRMDNLTQYTAVFPAVTQGSYTVWRDGTTRHGTLTIVGGEVTDYDWH